MHHIIYCHIITILFNYDDIRHSAFTKTHRARIHPRNARNNIYQHTHLYQNIRKRIILKQIYCIRQPFQNNNKLKYIFIIVSAFSFDNFSNLRYNEHI